MDSQISEEVAKSYVGNAMFFAYGATETAIEITKFANDAIIAIDVTRNASFL